MAAKRKNGGGASGNLTVRILQQLRDEIVGLRADTNARFESLERSMDERFQSLESATARGFEGVAARLDAVTARLENLRDLAGERYRDHEDRIRALEQQVGARGGPR